MSKYHIPVLLQETLTALQITEGKKYIDATVGGGGHASEILRLGGKVLGLDEDQDAIEYVKEKFKVQIGKELVLVRGNFRDIGRIARESGFENVAGILLDLGVSSYQIDTPQRGFSFMHEGPLDMRMHKETAVMAKDLVNGLTEGELTELFQKLGEEPKARRIAKIIVEDRKIHPITTTRELVSSIAKAYKVRADSTGTIAHIASRIFQALRIAVNDELHALEEALPQGIALLGSGGRMAVITFHSLEDRIVKKSFLRFENNGVGTILTKKPILPSDYEERENRRARSAKLRVFEKL
ncbi:MAG: 16S rRNA (cytosine(1402)-N(4))-methyltransferase RsmH [Candidatus Levybacteria bacterium]|nr:16S rRNA (cytosine(1402)-N(4))-methyltransferase RsmH [Candidatus Levybacteria bacterium]